MNELERAIGDDKDRYSALATKLQNGRWFTEALLNVTNEFRTVRNSATHETAVDLETATRWRNRLMGIGCIGDFVELARTKLK